jgi:hypothetical protein
MQVPRSELETWVWERRGIVPDLKLFMLGLLRAGDPEIAATLAGLKPGQAGLFQDMLLASGWASREGTDFALSIPPDDNGSSRQGGATRTASPGDAVQASAPTL